jgi:hypothetical protein
MRGAEGERHLDCLGDLAANVDNFESETPARLLYHGLRTRVIDGLGEIASDQTGRFFWLNPIWMQLRSCRPSSGTMDLPLLK